MSKNKNKHLKLDKLTSEEIKDGEDTFRPSDFMRARRPELFSDSRTIRAPQLPAAVLEYYLDTLTSRKQEVEFEHFCRRLAERELCPNLIPQSGPTGGGDSKVDTETYPVSDEIALRWYEGVGRSASIERWAFAFSAKKAWRQKIRSDVEKVVNENRGYTLIYFITNQFVKDKDRAQVEDELRKHYSIDVRLLDRSWIQKCIFEHDRIQLAIEALSISGYETIVDKKVTGPHDAKREQELKELEQQINNPTRYRGVEYQLAEDCLHAALLARGLERPRVDVDGRFQRAERIAEKVGHQQQKLRIYYNRAWTAFWWYNDFEELNRLYTEVERLAIGTSQAFDLELLSNLWTLLNTTIRRGELSKKAAQWDSRTVKLKKELQQLSTGTHRPNNALIARNSLLFIELIETLHAGKSPDNILKRIKKTLLSSQGLAEVPVESTLKIIRELGQFLADSPAYDELFEAVVSITEQRKSEGETGIVLLQRGYQKLNAGKKYDAIRLLGRAQQKLAMEEYNSDWADAIATCGVAYEAAGLLWAARANLLMASNQALSIYWKRGIIVPQALKYVQKLVWIELQLGRVFYALEWIELASYLASHLLLNDEKQNAFIEERKAQDIVLGSLLLKTELWELKWLDFLPQVLDRFALDYAWMALLYALGHEDYLRVEGVFPQDYTPDAVRDLFIQLVKQSAEEDLPERPDFLRSNTVTMRSFVLGSEVIIKAENTLQSLYLTEVILGAMEALLATSLDGELMPYRSEFFIDIRASVYISNLPKYWSDEDDGGQTIHIRHAPLMNTNIKDGEKDFYSWLQELIIYITLQLTMVKDVEAFAEQIFNRELGFGRALNFSDTEVAIKNILGESPKFRLTDWKKEAGKELFNLQRQLPWNPNDNEKAESADKRRALQPAEGPPPDGWFGVDNIKHKDRRVFSVINIPLWDKAKWQATAYVCYPNLPPILALGFTDIEPALRIFEQWHQKVGTADSSEHIRISIVTGVDKKHPSSYKIVISANPQFDKIDEQHSMYVVAARINQMHPPDSRNLDNFIEQYQKAGKYTILPAHFKTEKELPELFWDLSIEKKELRICPAWQIGENDLDVCAIQENDDPIIPNDLKDAPVIGALKRFNRRRKNK